MADKKITDMTALAAGSQATGDLLAVVDVSETAAANKNKKMTMENLFKGIPGNVGIGTSSPSVKLDVRGAAIFNEDGDDVDFRVESDDVTHMLFVDAGNDRVGIRQASPNTTLDVRGSFRIGSSSGTDLPVNTFDANGGVVFNEQSASVDFRVESNSNTHQLFVDGSADAVGINESTPNEALDVRGNIRIQDGNNLVLQNSSENRTLSINADDCTETYKITLPPAAPTTDGHVLSVASGGGTADVELEWAAGAGSISPLSADLDVGGFDIISTSNGNIDLTANGTGLIRVTENSLSQVPIVTQHDIGTAANEIPLNQHLGTAAFVDTTQFGTGQARAWINFNGSGTVAIRNSGGVSSITDNAQGDFTVSFANAFPDNDYAAVGNASWSSASWGAVLFLHGDTTNYYTSSHIRFITGNSTNHSTHDSIIITLAIFR